MEYFQVLFIGLYLAAYAVLLGFLLWRALYEVWVRWVRGRRCSIAELEASGSDEAFGERNHGGGQKHKDSGPSMPA